MRPIYHQYHMILGRAENSLVIEVNGMGFGGYAEGVEGKQGGQESEIHDKERGLLNERTVRVEM